MVEKLKSRYPTAMQIADGIEFTSPLPELEGWSIFVQHDLTENPEDTEEWIHDFVWKLKKPQKSGAKAKRRFIVVGTQQLGLDKLGRLPEGAQLVFQKYTHTCWQKKVDAVIKEMCRRWDRAEAQAEIDAGEWSDFECGS